MIDLTLHQPSATHTYRVRFNDVEVGSISLRSKSKIGHAPFWQWNVDTMPLMDRGGGAPSGRSSTLEAAAKDFRHAFERWIKQMPSNEWERNRDFLTFASRSSYWQE